MRKRKVHQIPVSKDNWVLEGVRFLDNLMDQLMDTPPPEAVIWRGQEYKRVDGVMVRWPEPIVGRVTLREDMEAAGVFPTS